VKVALPSSPAAHQLKDLSLESDPLQFRTSGAGLDDCFRLNIRGRDPRSKENCTVTAVLRAGQHNVSAVAQIEFIGIIALLSGEKIVSCPTIEWGGINKARVDVVGARRACKRLAKQAIEEIDVRRRTSK